MRLKTLKAIVAGQVVWMLAGCNNPDSHVICSADSKESVFARSLSKSQLETLYADSMEILAGTDHERIQDNFDLTHPRIPNQFAYLKPIKVRTFSGGVHSYVSFMLKGCMDEFIYLTVDKDKIVLSYSTGSAVDVGAEVLWSANSEVGTR